MYDPAGYMGVVIMQDARASYADTRPTADEARRTLSSYTSYFGTYTIDEGAGIITHHVEGNLSPNGTGADNRRAYEFDDDTLVLMPPRGSSGVQLRITWRREPELPGLTAEHRKFIGFWRYTSTERRADDGEVLPAASWENGFVIYTASGHMAVHLVRPDRQPYAASPPTDAEVLAALGSYASYFWAISGLPKGRKHLISQSFLGKVSVRPAQVGGVDVNTFLSELNWLLRMPNVDRILPRGRVATVRQGPRTVCKQARNRPLPRVTATARPARPIWTASAGSADVVPGDDANACVPTTYTVRVADLRAKLSWTTVV